ncbi:bacillithiol system redox-active protein YtxJ [Bacteroidota bacterium]
MGIFDKVFGKNETSEKKIKINWIPLTSISQLDEIITNKESVSVLFKHSTRCGISSGVLRQFETKNEEMNGALDFYYLDLLNYREISNAIAEKFHVFHQSPQAIVVKGGETVSDASHYDIINIDLEKFV